MVEVLVAVGCPLPTEKGKNLESHIKKNSKCVLILSIGYFMNFINSLVFYFYLFSYTENIGSK